MRSCSVIISTLVLAYVSGFGCASNSNEQGGPIARVGGNDAAELNARRNKFETSEDPPINVQTRFAAGQFAESQNAIPQAIGQYQETVRMDPKHQGAWYRLGVLHAKSRQFPQAIQAWENYIKVTGGEAVAYSNLGFCYEVAGNRAAAETAFKKGISVDPKNVACRVNYGLMLTRAGREPEALQQLRAVLSPAEAHYNVGSVYESVGKKDQARAHYRKALQLNPQLLDAQTRLAQMK